MMTVKKEFSLFVICEAKAIVRMQTRMPTINMPATVRAVFDGAGVMVENSAFGISVKEQATLLAGASIDHRVEVVTTEDHANRLADMGCCAATCSPTSIFTAGATDRLDSLDEAYRPARNVSTSQCNRWSPKYRQVPIEECQTSKSIPPEQPPSSPAQESSDHPTRYDAKIANSPVGSWAQIPNHLRVLESSRRAYHEWTFRVGMLHAKTPHSQIEIQAEALEATPLAILQSSAESTQGHPGKSLCHEASEISLENVVQPQ
jgi:hypothetical protein